MFGSLLCLLATSLASLGLVVGDGEATLEIVKPRPTYGYLGPTYPKEKGRLPGDIAHFSFHIKNLKLDKDGRAFYSFRVEVLDPMGQLIYKEGPTNSIAQNCLGGNLLPCHAHLEIPLDSEPGIYTLRIFVQDRMTKKSVKLESKGKVLKPEFGLVQVGTYADREGKVPTSSVGVLGQTKYVNFSAVNFARDEKTKQPNLEVSLRILDDKGQPTEAAPLVGKANKDVMEAFKLLPMQFGLTLNRVGQFTVELTGTDHITGKTTRVRLPLRVVPNQ